MDCASTACRPLSHRTRENAPVCVWLMAGICCLDCVLCVWYMWPDDRKHGSVCAVISRALTCVESIWVFVQRQLHSSKGVGLPSQFQCIPLQHERFLSTRAYTLQLKQAVWAWADIDGAFTDWCTDEPCDSVEEPAAFQCWLERSQSLKPEWSDTFFLMEKCTEGLNSLISSISRAFTLYFWL